jgi:hypothetical protein
LPRSAPYSSVLTTWKHARRRARMPSSPRHGFRHLLPRQANTAKPLSRQDIRRLSLPRQRLSRSHLQDGAPALATARRTRCTGRPTLLHHHRRHLRPAPLHHHRRCLHQSLLRLPLGARLMIRGLAWSRPGPCPRRLHLHLVLLRPTLAPRHPACALILALLDSSARALR